MKTLKFGIIGCGRIGRLHANNIISRVKNAEVVAITDVVPGVAEEFAKEVGIKTAGVDYKELVLNNPEVDAVMICSSTNTHSIISVEAAKAGKHIFCEKPIDFDLDKIREVIAEVEKAGIKYQVGFNRRFDRNFKKVKEYVAEGKVGSQEIFKITSRDPQAPPVEYVKVSGGMLLDMSIHDFDMVRYLSGSEVEEISVFGTCLVDQGIGEAGDIDTAIINMKLANGALAVIDNSRRAAYGYDQRVEAFGSLGQMSANNETATTTVYSTEAGVVSEKPLFFFLERYNDAFISEVEDFVAACLDDAPVPVGAVDGLRSVLIGLAAAESLKNGGAPVKVGLN